METRVIVVASTYLITCQPGTYATVQLGDKKHVCYLSQINVKNEITSR